MDEKAFAMMIGLFEAQGANTERLTSSTKILSDSIRHLCDIVTRQQSDIDELKKSLKALKNSCSESSEEES